MRELFYAIYIIVLIAIISFAFVLITPIKSKQPITPTIRIEIKPDGTTDTTYIYERP